MQLGRKKTTNGCVFYNWPATLGILLQATLTIACQVLFSERYIMQKIQISQAVALTEATALAEHYRSRALIHAQSNHELKIELQQLQAERSALTAVPEQGEAEHVD